MLVPEFEGRKGGLNKVLLNVEADIKAEDQVDVSALKSH